MDSRSTFLRHGVDRRGDGVCRVSGTIRNVRGPLEGVGKENPGHKGLKGECVGLEPVSNRNCLPRKSSFASTSGVRTKTDTGRLGEYPKALERTLVKELGKLAA